MSTATHASPGRAATGIKGLDEVLYGGFPRGRMYLVEGDPGSGKTTLALQYLLNGAEQGESGLYVILSETEEELRAVATSHGWSLDAMDICDLQAAEESLGVDSQYTLFHPSEVELSETSRAVLEAVERSKPARVVFDSLSEMRLLARDPLRYRRQVLALKHYFSERGTTVLLLDYESTGSHDRQLQSLAHGVIRLDQLTPEYGGQRRRLRVQKLRATKFLAGYHDFTIETGGLQVHPRLVAAEHRNAVHHSTQKSGIPELDRLLGGGLDRGTSTLILGPAGAGKSTLSVQFGMAAMADGMKTAFYVFDEVPDTLTVRAEGLGMNIRDHVAAGRMTIEQVDPAELSPGEFSDRVRAQVEERGAGMVVIDSLNGYQNAMPEEHFLSAHLHELLAYLNQQGVITIMVLAQHGILGESVQSPIDLSYLADTVILLRYFEASGEVRQAISVVKKRTGAHERTIRELKMTSAGVSIGDELREFQGVITGQLVYTGGAAPLLSKANATGAAGSE